MGGDGRRALVWAAAGLVVLGIGVGAFALGQASSGGVAVEEPLADVGEDFLEEEEEAPTAAPEPEQAEKPAVSSSVVVYISGAVAQPDTYALPADARVKDVVLAAGGLTEDAAADSVNLAERIADAQHIHIPRQGEAPAPQAQGASEPASAAGGLLNINSASADELESLPRIGAALAERIIEWRGSNGPFQTVEDVQQVKGVSASVYDEIKDLISVD
jgi:competence protein ComEA